MADNNCVLIQCTEPDYLKATFVCGHPFAFCELHGKQFYNYIEQNYMGACPICGAPVVGGMLEFEIIPPTY
jgi:hypothetical protein